MYGFVPNICKMLYYNALKSVHIINKTIKIPRNQIEN